MPDKKRILLIDDEKDFCYFVKTDLEQTGEFDVITASDGEDGIRLAKEEKPDLILMDIVMPGMRGDTAAKLLSSDSRTKNIPIIFISGIITEREMPADINFIAKPVGTKRLIKSIKKVIS